jgi:hypothetical protein
MGKETGRGNLLAWPSGTRQSWDEPELLHGAQGLAECRHALCRMAGWAGLNVSALCGMADRAGRNVSLMHVAWQTELGQDA